MKRLKNGIAYFIFLFSIVGMGSFGIASYAQEDELPGDGTKRCCQGGGTAKICNTDCGWPHKACTQTMECND